MAPLSRSRSSSIQMVKAVLVLAMIIALPAVGFAARPLLTDDAGTLGKGGFQVELGFETSDHRTDDDGVVTREDASSTSATLSYGILDNLDVLLGMPYEWSKVREDGDTIRNSDGIADLTLEAKWRFFEKGGFAMALKPGVSFATGDHKRGFGTGRTTYGALFIATQDIGPVSLHLNAGYRRNENDTDERKDIWGGDFAAVVTVAKPLKLVANVGTKTSTDRTAATDPAFFLGGLIYSITDKIDLDLGYKRGLNKAEPDNAYIGGLTIRF
ncbi:MAG TPA: transporter [Syntrophorhabdaceae bacterium]|nr:transporter [Syntrophorhabdaceae bacterium]